MSEERMRILNMLSEGKITAEEADKLLEALNHSESAASGPGQAGLSSSPEKRNPKWLRIKVDEPNGDKVNIRIPLKLIRGAAKLGNLFPKQGRDRVKAKLQAKGVPMEFGDMFSSMFSADAGETMAALGELDIDVVDKNGEKVRIYCE